MDTTGSLKSLSPSHTQANPCTQCLCVTGRCHTPGSWVTRQCARDACGRTQEIHSTAVSAIAAQPAFLFYLIIAKHKYLFISHAETTGVGSRGDTAVWEMGLCGQHGFLASLLATMPKFMIVITQNSTISSLN